VSSRRIAQRRFGSALIRLRGGCGDTRAHWQSHVSRHRDYGLPLEWRRPRHRRHLTASQRALMANQMARLPCGVKQDRSIDRSSQAQAVELMQVGEITVRRARRVEREAPELLEIKENKSTAPSEQPTCPVVHLKTAEIPSNVPRATECLSAVADEQNRAASSGSGSTLTGETRASPHATRPVCNSADQGGHRTWFFIGKNPLR
jgi:hypothetical protein